jgi:protein-S-isoprenylcysteine O-methyltransferase Ste14
MKLTRQFGRICGFLAIGLFVHLWMRTGEEGAATLQPETLLLDAALLVLFFASHSLLASQRFKSRLSLPPDAHRRLYLAVNLVLTVCVWISWRTPGGSPLWMLTGVAAAALVATQVAGIAGIAWTSNNFDNAEFFGANAPKKGQVGALSIKGPFALCRHPSYFFTFLLLTSPTMTTGRALLTTGVILYAMIGSWLEERKLLAERGEAYGSYRARTPWLVPTPRSIARAFSSKRIA